MTRPLDDREIRAMLEARAHRVHPDMEREIRAAVAAQLGRRGNGLEVPVRPIAVDRPPMRRPAWWGTGLAAALVVALAGLLVFGGTATRDGTAGSGSPSAGASSTASAAASPPVSAPAGLEMDAFRAQLAAGRLNGRVVLLTGTLEVTPIRCLGPAECQQIEVAGLQGVGVRYWSTTASAADVRAAIDAHPGLVPMAFRVDVSDLVLLGWPHQTPEAPVAVRELGGPAAGIGGDDLAIVAGWLVGGSSTVECPAPSVPWRCPGTEPWLTDEPPGSDGKPDRSDEIVKVAVDPSLRVGFGRTVIAGPFLVRYRAVRGWVSPFEVIAGLDPATTIRVSASPPDSGPPTGSLTAAQLRAGLQDGSLADRLILVDGTLQVAAIPCPAPGGPQCLTLFLPGLEGIEVVDDLPLASLADGSAPAGGRLLFRGGAGRLTYLGRVDDTFDHPVTVAYLLESLSNPGSDVLSVVSGWLVVGGVHSCPIQLQGATPCPGPPPWLTDDRPFDDGMLASSDGASVALTPAMAVQIAGRIVTSGPLLVRRVWKTAICDAAAGVDCSGAQWQVVAAFDPLAVVRAQVP